MPAAPMSKQVQPRRHGWPRMGLDAGFIAAGDAFEASDRPTYALLCDGSSCGLGSGSGRASDVWREDADLAGRRRGAAPFEAGDARAWLYTIALRLAFNHIRRHRRWREDAGTTASLRPGAIPASTRDLLGCPPRPGCRARRSALLLNAVDGYTQREIAAMRDVPEGTVQAASHADGDICGLRPDHGQRLEPQGRACTAPNRRRRRRPGGALARRADDGYRRGAAAPSSGPRAHRHCGDMM